jgi:16S rRNA processing protein RimM
VARVAGSRRRPTAAAPTPATAPAAEAGVVGALSPAEVAGEPDLLVVGRIGKPQGIKGEVTVQVRTDDPDARFAAGAVLLTDPVERGPLTVEAARWQNGRLVVLFEGVPDRNAAEALRETLLQVDARTLPAPEDEDEFHDHALRGMAAVLVGGAPLGEVVDVLHLPHGDVLVVRRDDNGVELLVPFVKAMVPVVDVAARRLEVDPPEGLLDLSEPAAEPDAEPDQDAPADEA